MSKRKSSSPQKKVKTWCENDISGYIPVLKKQKSKKIPQGPSYLCCAPTEQNRDYFLGKLKVGTTNNVALETHITNCKLRFNEECNTFILDNESFTIVVNIDVDFDFKMIQEIIATKMFPIEFYFENNDVIVLFYLKAIPLPNYNKKISTCLTFLMKTCLQIFPEQNLESSNEKQKCEEVKDVFQKIKLVRRNNLPINLNAQHPSLRPTLRPYQVDAVRWMINKETKIPNATAEIHPLWKSVTLPSKNIIYYNSYIGLVDIEKPIIDRSCNGGILAEEMGLGKTVEVFACILLNRKIEECNVENVEAPTITTFPFPIKLPKKRTKTYDEQKMYVINDDVKGNAKNRKSINRQALQKYYEAVLKGTTNSYNRKVEDPMVQCICSQQIEEDIIECVCCGKSQHKQCMGYDETCGPYKCSQCWMNEPMFDVPATLIITPRSLKKQWCDEIVKHISGKFRVLKYDGCRNSSLYPTKLHEYDLVITTYSVLQTELYLTHNNEEKTFRRKRIYSPPGSPLVRVNWWRLCLDEAQAVDAPNSMVSEMSKKLSAKLRWAITGTPMSRDLTDVYGLIEYLKISPYDDVATWTHCLYNPYVRGDHKPMCEFLSKVMWRSEKNDVLEQIDIPVQSHIEHMLEFSAVEKFFYQKEHEMSRDTFLSQLEKLDPNSTLRSLNKATLKKIMNPLLALRQGCTNPNSTKGKYLATRKKLTSMKELLEALIVKNFTECEEMLRVVISALNALAGINLLYKNTHVAIEEYRKVLQLSENFKLKENGALQVDTLQLIHTLHNLAEVIENAENVTPTLHDNTLKIDCIKQEEKYIGKFINESAGCFNEWNDLNKKTINLKKAFNLKQGQWYSDGMDYLVMGDYHNKVILKINNICENMGIECPLKENGGNILYIIGTWDRILHELREELIDNLNSLFTADLNDEKVTVINIQKNLVSEAMNCHLRPDKKGKKKRCQLCEIEKMLKKYEAKLFLNKVNQPRAEKKGESSWLPTLQEVILKNVFLSLKNSKANDEILNDGETHINLITVLKDEYKVMSKFWTHLYQQVSAKDELDICKIRLALKDSDLEEDKRSNVLKNLDYELKDKIKHCNLLNPHELGFLESIYRMEEKQSLANLERNLGIKKYLETLKKQQYEGQHPDPCPICKNTLENHWSILPCGHSYCLECIQLQLEKVVGKYLLCSICRQKFNLSDISYIKAGDTVDKIDTIEIKGNYSTKIDAVVKLLIRLKNKTPDVKVLIFSSWLDNIKIIQEALNTNHILNELISSTTTLEEKVKHFKDPSKMCTALLLPLNLGSKGLNLIEATHVILAEPILNPQDELQAIGRVHRIGQTRKTFIHRFVIKNTIEQSIHKAITSNSEEWEYNKVTIKQLTELFIPDNEDKKTLIPDKNMQCGPSGNRLETESLSDDSNQGDSNSDSDSGVQ
ncbi:unnamed protein product [Brassicogethes aeneus]|uniref:E3 ubiquitin-protein ligase SHPRH n=1 Tax=Brassicogethes aeneus TaxID=1431903 RepID=A0A9P0BGJ3_BRAAE|nr:unnamed protein product [Brassicogethes aeneus]